MFQRLINDTTCTATQDQEPLGFRMGKQRKMNELFHKWYVWNGRHDIWHTVLEEDVLTFVLDHTDIPILGILVMNDIEVLPLR